MTTAHADPRKETDMSELKAGHALDLAVSKAVYGWWVLGPEWKPSRDIATTWMIVEQMRGFGWCIQLECGTVEWYCLWVDMHDEHLSFESVGETASEAICRATIVALANVAPHITQDTTS